MKTIEELKALKEIGVTFYKEGDYEVKFTEYNLVTPVMPIIPTALEKTEPYKTLTLDEELFNQGI